MAQFLKASSAVELSLLLETKKDVSTTVILLLVLLNTFGDIFHVELSSSSELGLLPKDLVSTSVTAGILLDEIFDGPLCCFRVGLDYCCCHARILSVSMHI